MLKSLALVFLAGLFTASICKAIKLPRIIGMLACGNIVLSVAVLSIIITAPLGAFGMDITYKKLLTKAGEN